MGAVASLQSASCLRMMSSGSTRPLGQPGEAINCRGSELEDLRAGPVPRIFAHHGAQEWKSGDARVPEVAPEKSVLGRPMSKQRL